MVGFDTVAFLVKPDSDARLPLPAPDESGLEWYTASIILEDAAAYAALKAYRSPVTVVPAMGGGGLVKVRHGIGRKQLTYPTSSTAAAVAYAILTEIAATSYLFADSNVFADVTFAVLGAV